MKFNTIVEKDKSGLVMVLDAIDEIQEDKFIEGIRNRHHNIYEIEQTTEFLMIKQHRLNIELRALIRFSETFISQYATDYNECYDETTVLVGKIRSALSCLKKIFEKTSPIVRDKVPLNAAAPSVFQVSPLGHGEYNADIFGLGSFPKQVNDLLIVIETLITTASAILSLCNQMIESVEDVRDDIVQLRQIYKNSCNELLDSVKCISRYANAKADLPKNELEERRIKAKSEDNETFLRENYHRHSKKVFEEYVIIKALREAHNNGLTEIEAFFWRDDLEKALSVRKAIENFDFISGVEGKNGSLSSDVVVKFLIWSGVPQRLQRQLYKEYFVPNYSTYGKLKPLGWSTISDRRKFRIDQGITDEQSAEDFERMLLSAISDNSKSLSNIA